MKKLICICMMALVLWGLCLGASAEGEPQAVLAASQNVRQGKTVAVSVTLSDCGAVNGYKVELVYDKEVFTLIAGIWKQTNESLDHTTDLQTCEIYPAAEPGNSPIMTFTLRAAPDAELGKVCDVTCNITLLTDQGEIPVTVKPVQITINCPHEYHKNPTAEYLKAPATCLEPATYYESCSKCGMKIEDETRVFFQGEAIGHNFKDREINDYIAQPGDCQKRNVYYVSCVACGLQGSQTFEGRTFGEHVYDFDCDKKCNVCFAERVAQCLPGDILSCDDKGHWYTCTLCEGKVDGQKHVPGPEATPEEPQLCSVCGYVLAVHQDHTHDFSGEWLTDEENHWHQCLCGEVADREAHRWDTSDATLHRCVDCGQTKEIPQEQTQPTQPSVKPEPQAEEKDNSTLAVIVLGSLLVLSLAGNVALMVLLILKKRK